MGSLDESNTHPVDVNSHEVTAADLAAVRRRVIETADRVGLPTDHAAQFSLAVNEIVTNAIRYGDGTATVTITSDGSRVAVEVSDHGSGIPANVTGELPSADQTHGRGLWLARQLCDDLSIHSVGNGTVVRLSTAAGQP